MPRKDMGSVKAIWDNNAVNLFCDLCIEEISAGNRPTNYFTKEGWGNIGMRFFEISGRKYTKSQMRNKWDMLRDKWKLWRQLKTNESGLCWDSMRNTLYASEEWWNEKIKGNDKFKQFKSRGVSPDLEAKLNTMFVVDMGNCIIIPPDDNVNERTTTNDNVNERSGQQTNMGASGDSNEDLRVLHVEGLDDLVHEPEAEEHLPALSCSKKRQSHHIKRDKKAKVGKSGDDKFSSKPKQRLEEVHSMSNATSQVLPQSSPYSVLDAFKVLNTMEGVPKMSELKFFALNFILDKDRRDLFMAYDPDERLWLLKSFFEDSKK